MIVSSRLQPDQKRVKQAASSLDSATSTAKEDASKGGKTTTHPELEMAPSVSEGEELTPEEVQLVSQYILLDTIIIIINNNNNNKLYMVLQKLFYNYIVLKNKN